MFGSGCGVEARFGSPGEPSGNFSSTEKGLEPVRCGVVPGYSLGANSTLEGFTRLTGEPWRPRGASSAGTEPVKIKNKMACVSSPVRKIMTA